MLVAVEGADPEAVSHKPETVKPPSTLNRQS